MDVFDEHLAALNMAGDRLAQRNSRRRSSVSAYAETSANPRYSMQNVTEELDLQRVNTEISDNQYALRILEQEIAALEARRAAGGLATAEVLGDRDFENANRHMSLKTYRPIFCISFLLTCVIMFMVEIGENGWTIEDTSINPLFGPSVQTLIDLGAKDTELIVEGQQYYRLIVPMVLHVGVIHLAANMLGLVMIGIPMEQEFGPCRIGIIIISSGIFGILMSAVFAPRIVGVGASGAIYGLFGAAWADLVQNWNIYKGQNYSLLAKLTFYTLLNFAIGLMPYLDNFAHLGGFICGLVWGLTLLVKARYDYFGAKKVRKNFQLLCQAFAIIILPIIFVAMVLILFLQIDAAASCDFCSYISCVPFPPGVPKNQLWWDCTPCTNGEGDYYDFVPGSSVVIVCPEGSGNITEIAVSLQPNLDEATFKRNFAAFCALVCEN